MCQGWIAMAGLVAAGLAAWLVLELVRTVEKAESQLRTVIDAQIELEAERDHLFDQVNRLQEARLDRELERLEAEEELRA